MERHALQGLERKAEIKRVGETMPPSLYPHMCTQRKRPNVIWAKGHLSPIWHSIFERMLVLEYRCAVCTQRTKPNMDKTKWSKRHGASKPLTNQQITQALATSNCTHDHTWGTCRQHGLILCAYRKIANMLPAKCWQHLRLFSENFSQKNESHSWKVFKVDWSSGLLVSLHAKSMSVQSFAWTHFCGCLAMDAMATFHRLFCLWFLWFKFCRRILWWNYVGLVNASKHLLATSASEVAWQLTSRARGMIRKPQVESGANEPMVVGWSTCLLSSGGKFPRGGWKGKWLLGRDMLEEGGFRPWNNVWKGMWYDDVWNCAQWVGVGRMHVRKYEIARFSKERAHQVWICWEIEIQDCEWDRS